MVVADYQNTLMTAFLFPGVVFGVFFVLNFFVWSKGSSSAVPFGAYRKPACCLLRPHACMIVYLGSTLWSTFVRTTLPVSCHGGGCPFMWLVQARFLRCSSSGLVSRSRCALSARYSASESLPSSSRMRPTLCPAGLNPSLGVRWKLSATAPHQHQLRVFGRCRNRACNDTDLVCVSQPSRCGLYSRLVVMIRRQTMQTCEPTSQS